MRAARAVVEMILDILLRGPILQLKVTDILVYDSSVLRVISTPINSHGSVLMQLCCGEVLTRISKLGHDRIVV